jgi:hypothetical protein
MEPGNRLHSWRFAPLRDPEPSPILDLAGRTFRKLVHLRGDPVTRLLAPVKGVQYGKSAVPAQE